MMRSPGPSVRSAPSRTAAPSRSAGRPSTIRVLRGRQAQPRNLELAALHGQRRFVAAKCDLAPAAARGPEIDPVSSACRGESDFADALVEGQSDKGVQERIARQRARIIAAALDLVPGIAARSVVARARRANDRQPLFDKSARDQMRGEHVFEAGPDLFGVGHRHGRLLRPLRPRAHQKPRFVFIGVDAARIEMLLQRRAEVVAIDRAQRRTRFFRATEDRRGRRDRHATGRGSGPSGSRRRSDI